MSPQFLTDVFLVYSRCDDPHPAVPAVLSLAGGVRAVPVRVLPGRGAQLGPGRGGAGAVAGRGLQDLRREGPGRHQPGQPYGAGEA